MRQKIQDRKRVYRKSLSLEAKSWANNNGNEGHNVVYERNGRLSTKERDLTTKGVLCTAHDEDQGNGGAVADHKAEPWIVFSTLLTTWFHTSVPW